MDLSLDMGERASRKWLRALVLCDLVDSTALVQRLGDAMATRLTRQHDEIGRTLLRKHEGQEIDRTDGFLLLFETPTVAVRFAIDYQRALGQLGLEVGELLLARVAVHFAELVTWSNQPQDVENGARASEIDGLALSVVSRLASLALPGQILISDVAESIARRSDQCYGESVRWATHGRYHLKGIGEPLNVFARLGTNLSRPNNKAGLRLRQASSPQ